MNKERIFSVVKKIPVGKFLTYKKIARLIGKEKAYRYVANILAKNCDPNIPCHRVIRDDYTIGGYLGSYKNSWKKLALLLKEGVIAVMPSDTIYGICGNAFKEEIVKKIYKLRKRSPQKPMIILISDLDDLKKFGIRLSLKEKLFLNKIWPDKISVVLDIKETDKLKKLNYLHRGTRTLAFRLPRPKWLRELLKISGPLVAPSANWEGYKPAETIFGAKKYFGNKVIYFDSGRIEGRPSVLIKLHNDKVEILRQGEKLRKIKKLIQ